jgi:hypothetical protein
MPVWSEDLSQFTVEEVVQSHDENRAWYKDLRSKVNALMDTKLAKQISPEEYSTALKPLKDDLAECERRGRILRKEAGSL